ncbi:MAG: DUF327 family protein [Synergistaceae bacterium]|jgi:uncharacterized protein YaaR (DUF327 family)|nr:DUF327 family protein [Synergistaceae bacterium]
MKASGIPKAKAGETALLSAGGRSGTGKAVGGVLEPQETFAEVAEDMESRMLIDELESIGLRLSRFPTAALLARYRELVRMALEKVRNGTRIKRDFKWRRTERSMFVVIERTEEALDEMDEALLREADRTRLLSLMEEIKGCLISLLF